MIAGGNDFLTPAIRGPIAIVSLLEREQRKKKNDLKSYWYTDDQESFLRKTQRPRSLSRAIRRSAGDRCWLQIRPFGMKAVK
jgi:hypothetical protein